MRQVSVGKATALALCALVLASAVSGGAVHMMNRNKVAMYIPHPQVLAGACTVVLAVHRHSPKIPIMLDPTIFGREARLDSKIFFNVKPDLAHFEVR